MTRYRVVRITVNDFSDKTTEDIIWEGEGIEELSLKYPPSQIFGADELGHREIEDGFIRFRSRFEVQNKDLVWLECPDPRVRYDHSLSDYEYEVDKENRRLFPGDYIEDDSVDIDDDWREFDIDILGPETHSDSRY